MPLIDMFRVHTVTVEPQLGEGSTGDVYGPAESVLGFLDYERKLVRSAEGAEVVSEATFYCDLEWTNRFPPDSRVTTPAGVVTFVIGNAPKDDGGITGLSHLEVTLQ
jgi:hypothetical protein